MRSTAPDDASDAASPSTPLAWRRLRTCSALFAVQFVVFVVTVLVAQQLRSLDGLPAMLGFVVFTGIGLVQVGFAIAGIVEALRHRGRRQPATAFAGLLLGLAAVGAWGYGVLAAMFSMGGAAWGRPLRLRGRQVHPELEPGDAWSRGERPCVDDLQPATRSALEALWLHDAQKEHASVPAFARVSWLLAAAGAPPELMLLCQRAAIEEIDHTRRCFALAQGYGGRSHTVRPMPELAREGVEGTDDPLWTLASESLGDGCLLEEFNADVAAECAEVCEEPATRSVLQRIAREERSHADFSWRVLAWVHERADETLQQRLREAVRRLANYRRPTAANGPVAALVAAADPVALHRHGRLPDARWAELWDIRLRATIDRAERLLGAEAELAAAAR